MGEMYDDDGSQDSLMLENSIGDMDKTFSSLIEQTPEGHMVWDVEVISDPEKLIEFWENEISVVENELPALFKLNSLELLNPETTDDIDFIRYSAKYGLALRALNEVKTIKANEDLLKYWLFALKKYFWRASNYIITLQYYRDNLVLKNALMDLYKYGKNYEAYRYHLITCMNYNFVYMDKELRDFYKILKEENSALSKYALYCLIIKQSNNPQLLSTIKANLNKENSEYLKLMVLDYWRNRENRMDSMEQLIKSIGL